MHPSSLQKHFKDINELLLITLLCGDYLNLADEVFLLTRRGKDEFIQATNYVA